MTLEVYHLVYEHIEMGVPDARVRAVGPVHSLQDPPEAAEVIAKRELRKLIDNGQKVAAVLVIDTQQHTEAVWEVWDEIRAGRLS